MTEQIQTEAHDRENLIVHYENDEFILAQLKCQIPKDTFTKEWHVLYKQKPFMLGGWVISGGVSLADFKKKAEVFKRTLANYQKLQETHGAESSWSVKAFLEEEAPPFIRFFDWIDSLIK